MSADPVGTEPPAITVPGSSVQLVRPVFRLLIALRGHGWLFIRSTASMTAYQLAAAAAAGTSAYIAALVVADQNDSGNILTLLFVGLVVAIVTHAVFAWTESWLSHVLAYRVIDGMRLRLFDAIERITPGGMKKRRTGEVAGAAMSDVESLEWFYAHTVGSSINAVINPLILSALLTILVGPPGLIAAVGVLLLLAVPWLLGPVQARQGAELRAELGDLKAISLEGAEGIREILALGLAGQQRDRVLASTGRIQRRKLAFALRAGTESALADIVIAVTTIVFLLVLARQVSVGQLDPVLLPAAIVLLGASFGPAAGAFAMFQRLGEMSAAATRVLEVIHAPAQVTDPPSMPDSAVDGARGGALRFEGVSFAYTEGQNVLSGFTLDVPAGQTVAVVGASGAGKTTLAHLLVRFWDPTHGSIQLDGTDLRSLSQEWVRDRIALIPQRPYIFRGTIRSNLTLAAPGASTDALWRALGDAQLADTVRKWPNGLDEEIGENGATLSGGQRQRLAIAQALLRSPSVLVMDEAVAHLDAIHEQALAEAIARVRAGRTTLVIAHRISTIRHAHRVVLLDRGQIIADGPHDQLIATSEEYRSVLAQVIEDDSTVAV